MLFAILLTAEVRAAGSFPAPGILLPGDADPNSAMARYEGILLAAALGAIDTDSAPDGRASLTPLAYAERVELWPERKDRSLWSSDGIFRLPPSLQIDSPLLGQLPWALASGQPSNGALGDEPMYPLNVPLPRSARLSWGLTPYDPEHRSDFQTKTLGSHFLNDVAPPDRQPPWLDTLPGDGWLFLFSVHGNPDSHSSP
jgi:hypothetical protein